MTPLEFFVPGTPAPAGSKRAFVLKGGANAGRAIIVDANKNAKPWQSDVKHIVANNYFGEVLRCPLRVTFTFFVHRPKGHYGSGKNADSVKASAPNFPAGKPDVLKLARAVEDALSGIVWVDDAQIVQEILAKEYAYNGKASGVRILVEEPQAF